jgi:hypothetical protein
VDAAGQRAAAGGVACRSSVFWKNHRRLNGRFAAISRTVNFMRRSYALEWRIDEQAAVGRRGCRSRGENERVTSVIGTGLLTYSAVAVSIAAY